MDKAQMDEAKYLYLTTRGHISGRAHEIEIWYVTHDARHYIIAEKREAAHWVQNLRADPAVAYRLGDLNGPAHASVPSDPELIAAVKAKMDAKHGWSNGLVVEIAPR